MPVFFLLFYICDLSQFWEEFKRYDNGLIFNFLLLKLPCKYTGKYMTTKTEYKYPKNWFKYNLIAVPTGFAGGNCSACLFRNNAPLYCDKLACVYVDSDYIEAVYWIAKDYHANLSMWPELVKFFAITPKQRIRDISNDILTKAILSKKSENSI